MRHLDSFHANAGFADHCSPAFLQPDSGKGNKEKLGAKTEK